VKVRTAIAGTLALALSAVSAQAQNDWPSYGHDRGGSQYSPLKQISTQNVAKLQRAWVYHYGVGASDLGDPFQDYRFEVTPLMVGGVMYLSTPASAPGRKPDVDSTVLALDPETGKVIWKYTLPRDRRIYGRGVAYWPGEGKTGARIVFGTHGGYLCALDAKTGKPVEGFGEKGQVDTYPGVTSENVPAVWRDRYTIPNPVSIYHNLIITGSRPGSGEAGPPGPRGDVRAWDARTGKFVWTFHTVPQPGEPGHETWGGDSWKDMPGAGVWSTMTVDTERGIVYAPIEAPQPDRSGGDRPGANLYANSLIALDANTGKLVWYKQLIHHDIWDYDLPTPPVLMNIVKDGKKIPAVAQEGKTGLLFILDRTNGEPVYPIEERPVPKSDNTEDPSWPTQPFPVKPPPLARTTMTRNDIAKVTPELQKYCQQFWDDNKIQDAQPYQRPTKGVSTLQFPGPLGGANWGGPSYDPQTGYLFVNVFNLAILDKIRISQAGKQPAKLEWGRVGGVKGFFAVNGFADPANGTPCWAPPWGELIAVQVSTGEIAWRVPLGFTQGLGADGPKTGTYNMGGNIATAGGLIFIGATNDGRFRAFDTKTGKELWSAELDASGHATPMTYMGKNKKQYVVIAAGGGTAIGNPHISDSLIAFTLP
jgi:glucose dehydrogenase